MMKKTVSSILTVGFFLSLFLALPVGAFAAGTITATIVPGVTSAKVTGKVSGFPPGTCFPIGYSSKIGGVSPDSQGNFSKILDDLSPQTTYTLLIDHSDCTVGGASTQVFSKSFTTLPKPVAKIDYINGAGTTATMTGSVSGITDTSKVDFKYSFAGSPGWTHFPKPKFTENNFTVTLPNLVVGTSYDYEMSVSTVEGYLELVEGTFEFTAKSATQNVPTNVTAVAGAGSAIVSFTPSPTDPVGTTYYATSSPDYIRATGNSSPITVPGLTNGKEYTFQVTAVYNSTDSAPSVRSNPIVPTATAGNADLHAPFQLKNPIGGSGSADLLGFLGKILDFIVLILTPVMVLALVYCGFLFVSAQGNAEKITDAKKMLMYTLIGCAVILGAHTAANIIGNTVGALVS